MIKVGITGGIGSGKSTVCQIFSTLGIPVYNADNEARWLTDHNLQIVSGVKKLFGNDIYKNGMLNRKKVGAQVFGNKDLLAQLNEVIHPVVAKHFDDWLKRHEHHPFILKEAAILFESGAHLKMDKVITVTAPKELRVLRVIKRDGLSKAEVESRMSHQMPEEEKVKMSDYTIHCNDVDLVIPQVLRVYDDILR